MEVTRKLSENRAASAFLRDLTRRFAADDSGQAATEYILIVAVLVSLGLFMASTLRASTFKMWKYFAVKIAAPCPSGCKSDLK